MHWRRTLRRAIVVWLVTSLSIWLLSSLFGGFEVESWQAAMGMALVFGLLNALIWPVLIRLALPLTVFTLGLGVLFLNGTVVFLAAKLPEETIYLSSFGTAIIVAFGITLINTLLMTALAVEDDDFYYLNVAKRRMRATAEKQKTDKTGVLFLEIDGLAHDVLMRALRDGNAPTMSRWLREGSHKLIRWETDWSSQTGAMQAGILHGNNTDMPAFRWWEKNKNKAMVSNHPKDAMEIERRHSDGNGLLADGGASRANLLSGDASHSLLTMSTVLKKDREGRIGQDYYTYFANPYNLIRTIMLTLHEIGIELWQAHQQKRLNIRPRVHRGFTYALLRAWTTVIQRDLQAEAIIGDIMAGRPVGYTTFLGYDEVAHHSGIERIDALAVLRRIDKQFRRIESALRLSPRPYELVVLSDHGQTQGETFLGRYELSLQDLIDGAIKGKVADIGGQGDEGSASLAAGLTEVNQGQGFVSKTTRLVTRSKVEDSAVILSEEESKSIKAGAKTIVMASGCLGLIYFNDIAGRARLEQINRKYPKIIDTLVNHPGIGFILVKSKKDGSIVIGKQGRNYLDKNKIAGIDPLKPYGKNAARHVKRTSDFTSCGDIMINSKYWPMTAEVAAFEELVGSHGGLGGTQNHPFILYPANWKKPTKAIIGAEQVNKQLKSWLGTL